MGHNTAEHDLQKAEIIYAAEILDNEMTLYGKENEIMKEISELNDNIDSVNKDRDNHLFLIKPYGILLIFIIIMLIAALPVGLLSLFNDNLQIIWIPLGIIGTTIFTIYYKKNRVPEINNKYDGEIQNIKNEIKSKKEELSELVLRESPIISDNNRHPQAFHFMLQSMKDGLAKTITAANQLYTDNMSPDDPIIIETINRNNQIKSITETDDDNNGNI